MLCHLQDLWRPCAGTSSEHTRRETWLQPGTYLGGVGQSLNRRIGEEHCKTPNVCSGSGLWIKLPEQGGGARERPETVCHCLICFLDPEKSGILGLL